MSLCIAAGGPVLALAVGGFTLSWNHSVEHITWWERWEVTGTGLRPVEARVIGPGAGMEAPEGATRHADGWHYRPDLPPQPEVFLAASGATGAGWTLCAAGACHEIGATEGAPVHLWVALDCMAAGAGIGTGPARQSP
ncbi:MAG: DUF1850 domain-containing protein [Sphingomonadales bacterium]|nr:DUF1850 domain-containing protein [Sphingomonadales bacterium]